jgi:hypothetical protein
MRFRMAVAVAAAWGIGTVAGDLCRGLARWAVGPITPPPAPIGLVGPAAVIVRCTDPTCSICGDPSPADAPATDREASE